MYKLIKSYVPISPKRTGEKLKSNGTFTIHSTANPTSTPKNERDNVARADNTRVASFHYVIGQSPTKQMEVYQLVPDDEITWHASDGRKAGGGNMGSISLEICESGDRQATINAAICFVADYLFSKGWGVDALRRHRDWANKNCPSILNVDGKWSGWVDFKNRVGERLQMMEELASMTDRLNRLEKLNENLIKIIEKHVEEGAPPKWFEKEFPKWNTKISEPNNTKDFWRGVAVAWRGKP